MQYTIKHNARFIDSIYPQPTGEIHILYAKPDRSRNLYSEEEALEVVKILQEGGFFPNVEIVPVKIVKK